MGTRLHMGAPTLDLSVRLECFVRTACECRYAVCQSLWWIMECAFAKETVPPWMLNVVEYSNCLL